MSVLVLHHLTRNLCTLNYHHFDCFELVNRSGFTTKTTSFTNEYSSSRHCTLWHFNRLISLSWIYLCIYISKMWWLYAVQLRLVSSNKQRNTSVHFSHMFDLGKYRQTKAQQNRIPFQYLDETFLSTPFFLIFLGNCYLGYSTLYLCMSFRKGQTMVYSIHGIESYCMCEYFGIDCVDTDVSRRFFSSVRSWIDKRFEQDFQCMHCEIVLRWSKI